MTTPIDITFDFRSDCLPGQDPDTFSPTLRRYHKLLWSKPLPDGKPFDLDDSKPAPYLRHQSGLGKFVLSSDTMSSSYKQVRKVADIRDQVSEDDMDRFRTKMYSIGNFIMFPANQIDGKWTINQARGCNRQIGDRFDLTLECIRLHYLDQTNPLEGVLNRYADFFSLFGNFRGYADFFLLRDMVSGDGSAVKFFLPFEGFEDKSPYPDSVEAFKVYIREATRFIQARNQRILEYAQGLSIPNQT